MSINAENTWKLPINRLNLFLNRLEAYAKPRIIRAAKNTLAEVSTEDLRPIYRDHGWSQKMSWEEYLKQKQHTHLPRRGFELIRKKSNQSERDFDCVDLSVNIWLVGQFAYAKAIGEYAVFHFEEFCPRYAESYDYTSAYEPDEEMNPKVWAERRKFWLARIKDWNKGRMVHTIMNGNTNDDLVKLASWIYGPELAWEIGGGIKLPAKP